MSLPILNYKPEVTSTELVRYFHKSQRLWAEHVAEFDQLDCGTAFFNASLNEVHDANRILDAALPPGTTPQDAMREADAFFSQKGTRCWKWTMNPSSPAEQTEPLVSHLAASGFARQSADIMHLAQGPSRITEIGGLTIIPARASFRHAEALAGQANTRGNIAQFTEAAMLHLDDPHWDALLALKDGTPVARAGVLAIGEIGLIEHLFVAEPFRRQGIGRTMMSRVLEICARSLFKHVLLGVAPDNTAAIQLFTKLGFLKIGEFVEYAMA